MNKKRYILFAFAFITLVGAGGALWIKIASDGLFGLQVPTPEKQPTDPRVLKFAQALEEEECYRCDPVYAALHRIWPDPVDAVPAFVRALEDDEDAAVRKVAILGLGRIGPEHDDVAPALIQALLKDEDAQVREAAAWALVRIGSGTAGVAPALIQALAEDEDAGVRKAAASVLGRFPRVADGIPALVRALEEDREPSVREAAIWALRERESASHRLGEIETAGIVPALIRALEEDEDAGVREVAASALGAIGPEAKVAVPALIQALGDQNLGVRARAADALHNIAGKSFDMDAAAWMAWWEAQE